MTGIATTSAPSTERDRAASAPRRSSRRPPSWVLYGLGVLPLALGGVVDLPRTRALGSMSGLGALTIAESAVAGIVLLACASYPRVLLARLAPFAALLVWGVASMAWAMPDVKGMQNFTAYLLLAFAAASAGALAARSRPRTELVLDWAVGALDVVALALVAASLRAQSWTVTTMHEAVWLVHPRSVALTGLVSIAWHLARWYYGRQWDLVPVALWVAAIFVSLSRMATGTALVLVAIAAVLHYRARPRAALPRLALPVAGLAVVIIAALSAGPFHDRLFRNTVTHAPVVAVPGRATQDDAEFNDSDRPLFWTHVARSAAESPIVGKGIGSSQAVMNERWPGVGHPHNDYLRIWHDLGLIGFATLVASFVTWGRALARDWRQGQSQDGATHAEYDDTDEEPAQLELAGLLALVALALPMVTDNALVYPFVVGPVGVLVGAGLGARAVGGTGGRRSGLSASPNAVLTNPLDARWTWKPKYPVRRRRRRA